MCNFARQKQKDMFDTKILQTQVDEKPVIIQDFTLQSEKRNQLLFFFKPESFEIQFDDQYIELVNSIFEQYDIESSGISVLPGSFLESNKIMDAHYGYINKLSRWASKIITTSEIKEIIADYFKGVDPSTVIVKGGHEFLESYNSFSAEELNTFWATKKSFKLRSGFYFQLYNLEGDQVLIINGFHPEQLLHFTKEGKRIAIALLNSNENWNKLKFDLIGDTFPEKAKMNSLRRNLYEKRELLGAADVSVANNFVHLSAGPLEALFEIRNFLEPIFSKDFNLGAASLYRQFRNSGFSTAQIDYLLSNPNLKEFEGKDAFTVTENIDTDKAISILQKVKY